MYVTPAVTITDAMVTSTTAPDSIDTDTDPNTGAILYPGLVVWTATSFAEYAYVLHTPTQSIWQANAATVGGDVPGASTKWTFIAKNNPLRMFDGKIASQTVADDGFSTTVTASGIVGSLAGFNISGVSVINITVDGTTYDRDIQMLDNSGVTNEWWYFFAPIVYRTSFAVYDLPGTNNPEITMDFQTTGTARVGEIIIGNRKQLGVAIDGSGFDNDDLSYVTYDDFGNVDETIVRPNRNILNYNVKTPSDRINYLRTTLENIGKTRKCAWAGSTDVFDDMLGYGFYETFSCIIYSDTSDVSIKVRTVV